MKEQMGVNCGKWMNIQSLEVELLSKEISGHETDIVCTYYMEEGKKVEVAYYHNKQMEGSEIYFFNSATATHCYYSRNYTWMKDLPNQYVDTVNKLILIHKEARENGYFRTKDGGTYK